MSTVNACRSRETRFSVLNGRLGGYVEHSNPSLTLHTALPRAHRLGGDGIDT